MTTAEAAQKWAEAKELLKKAEAALLEAKAAHEMAASAEDEAWDVLQSLSGHVPVPRTPPTPSSPPAAFPAFAPSTTYLGPIHVGPPAPRRIG